MKHRRFLAIAAIALLVLAVLPLTSASAAAACSINYVVSNDWGTGASVDLTIINSGTTAINGWTLTWNFPGSQAITYLWNGSYTQAGTAVSVTNTDFNAVLLAGGGTAAIGFNMNYSGANAAPTNFVLNGVACNSGGATSTATSVAATSTRTATAVIGPSATITRTATAGPSATRTRTPTTGPSATRTRTPTTGPSLTPTRTSTQPGLTATPTPTTSGPTATPGALNTGNATWFESLGSPYGGCGLPQSILDTQNFVALNVQNSPGDYATFHTRPIAPEFASQLGFFNNGLNCGRWVRVTISDNCNGVNDGAMNQPFCRGGTGWFGDQFNGATLDMVVADSCYDGNAWCRDDPNHLDLAKGALNLFVKNGLPIGNMFPDSWNNRHIQWEFIEAPNYTGDIRVGFILSAQPYWPAIVIAHLKNGIHGVDYYDGTNWVKAAMNGDMGEAYLIGATTPMVNGVPGTSYRIRVYDVNDQLINNGRIYNFSFPASCGTICSPTFTEISYTVE